MSPEDPWEPHARRRNRGNSFGTGSPAGEQFAEGAVSISEAPLRAQPQWAPSALLAVFFFNLLVRGDGYFPFSRSVEPHLFSFVVLLQTLILIVCTMWTASVLIGTGTPVGRFGMSDRTQFVLAVSSIALIGVLQLLNARRFAELGYAGRPVLLVALLLGASLALALLWRKNRFYGILLADLILKAYPLICFPITAKRSDMLPVIGEAARSMLAGENIYRTYLLDNGVWTQMVRFPGLVMSYAPATLFHVDPRLMTLAGEVLFFVLLYRRFGRSPLFASGAILLALSPYWHFRHELYEAPFWVALAVLLLALERRDSVAEVAALSIVVCMHQWGVLFLPFVSLFLVRLRSRGLAVTASALAVGALIVAVASGGDLAAFWQQTVTYYTTTLASWAQQGAFPRTSLYLTPWIAAIGGAAAVKLASVILVTAAFAWACLRLRGLSQLVGFLALALLGLLLTNTVAWTYQYLLVGALLWIGLMLKAEDEAGISEGGRAAR
jgi:hypothetical protein